MCIIGISTQFNVESKSMGRIWVDALHSHTTDWLSDILYFSVARAWTFLWCIETEFSYCKSSLNEDIFSPYLISKAHWCYVFFFF